MNAAAGRRRERAFERMMAARGVTLTRNKERFRFGLSTYTPDFYEPATQTFYEVIGSRQRFHQIMPKLDLMRCLYPMIPLHVVTPQGEGYRRHRWQHELGQAVDEALQRRQMTARILAKHLGVHQGYLSQVLTGRQVSRPVTRRLMEWLETGDPPRPVVRFNQEHEDERRALAVRLCQRLVDEHVRPTTVARGLGVSPQLVNDVLHQFTPALPMLRRIEAWLDSHPDASNPVNDRRTSVYKATNGNGATA